MKYLIELEPGDWIIHIEKVDEDTFKLWGKKAIECELKARGMMPTNNGPLAIYAFSGKGMRNDVPVEKHVSNLYHTLIADNVTKTIRNKAIEFIYDGIDSIIDCAHEINVDISKENPHVLDIVHMIEEEDFQHSDGKVKINFD